MHFRDWMFFNNDLSGLEILSPNLDTLKMMKEYEMDFVVKGFKNTKEFLMFNKLRIKYGTYKMLYTVRCLGNEVVVTALNALANKEQLPTSEEVSKSAEMYRLTKIDNNSEKRILERERYKRLSEKYYIILHRKILRLIKQHRVDMLLLSI
jgi:hypothetical protein